MTPASFFSFSSSLEMLQWPLAQGHPREGSYREVRVNSQLRANEGERPTTFGWHEPQPCTIATLTLTRGTKRAGVHRHRHT